ncbi:hypothetical protein FO519_002981 [Halicephalobus sp. NKZ332]|nr:hypothetical protein FO519_002981 [Halicephalobus sp. NKZ332]
MLCGEPGKILVNSETLFTIPHEGDFIRFQCSDKDEAVAWILPDEAEVLISQKEENSTFIVVEPRMNVTKNFLDIKGIESGMDGQYICILADSSRRNFFIPHIVSKARLTKSITISLSVTGIFCVICLIILLVDRYCFSDIDDVKAQIVQKSIKKKNISSATISKSEIV